jgi:hypothetical protein
MRSASGPGKPTSTRSELDWARSSSNNVYSRYLRGASERVGQDRGIMEVRSSRMLIRGSGIATAAVMISTAAFAEPTRSTIDADDFGDWACPDDEHSGPRLVLLRHGPQEEHSFHHGADVALRVRRLSPVGGSLLQPDHFRRRRTDRHARSRLLSRYRCRYHVATGRDHSGTTVCGLSNDLRGYHGCAGRWIGRGSNALRGIRLLCRSLAARSSMCRSLIGFGAMGG